MGCLPPKSVLRHRLWDLLQGLECPRFAEALSAPLLAAERRNLPTLIAQALALVTVFQIRGTATTPRGINEKGGEVDTPKIREVRCHAIRVHRQLVETAKRINAA
jgi:hypothetical protein